MLTSLVSFTQTTSKTTNNYPNFIKIGNDTIGQFKIDQCRIMASDLAQYVIVDSMNTACEANAVLYKSTIKQLKLLVIEKNTEIGKWENVNTNINMRLSNKDIEINAKNEDINRLAKKLKWQKVATKVAYGVAIVGVVATALYLSKN